MGRDERSGIAGPAVIFSLAAALLALSIAGCVAQSPQTVSADGWAAVVADASLADANDAAVPPLTPLTGDRVRLVTWKRMKDAAPSADFITVSRPLWSTVDGELQRFCRWYVAKNFPDSAALRRRVEQLLGLRPGDGEERVIIEFEVDARDVFRPCPDPATNTESCPARPDHLALVNLFERDPQAARILLEQVASAYVREGGYPFTRRGYTYDWSPSASRNHFGLSEYVTRPDASIRILSVSPSLDAYCAQ